MCGIVVAKDIGTFLSLCKLNESRGNYSYGGLYVNDYGYMLQRNEGTIECGECPPEGFNVYLGHNRAPTSDVSHFDPNHSHPFVYGDWIVAHNGIIRNFEKLQEVYKTRFKVDSNIIPFLINKSMGIRYALDELIGTFGCWFYGIQTGHIYIYRSTNSLFYSKTLHAISSIEFKDSVMMKDNTLFAYDADEVREVFNFDSSESPFYIPE